MAGIFALLYGLTIGAINIADNVKNDIYSYNAQKDALKEKNDIFYDRQRRPHWAQTGELVDIKFSDGEYIVVGKRSKKVYRNRSIENKNKKHEVFKEAIKLAKERNMKYFQWYFDTDYEKDCVTGYEIETGKKYLMIDYSICGKKKYKLFYLNPNRSYYFNNGICYYHYPFSVTEYVKKEPLDGNYDEYEYGFARPKDKFDLYDSYLGKVDKIINEDEYIERSSELKEYRTMKEQYYDRYSPF